MKISKGLESQTVRNLLDGERLKTDSDRDRINMLGLVEGHRSALAFGYLRINSSEDWADLTRSSKSYDELPRVPVVCQLGR
jgi:hypothetical protein